MELIDLGGHQGHKTDAVTQYCDGYNELKNTGKPVYFSYISLMRSDIFAIAKVIFAYRQVIFCYRKVVVENFISNLIPLTCCYRK